MTDDIRNGKFYDENYHHVSRRQASKESIKKFYYQFQF